MTTEYWKEIPEFTDYEASSLGNIRVLDKWVDSKLGSQKFVKGKQLKINKKSSDGTFRVGLTHNKKQYFKFVHRIIAQTFLPNPDNKDFVIHVDRNNQNNNVDNLYWATFEEVQALGHYSQKLSGKIYQLNNHRSKKTVMIDSDGKETEYKSQSEAGRDNNRCISNINHALTGRYPQVYGKKWRQG